jgi:hypothetical protein
MNTYLNKIKKTPSIEQKTFVRDYLATFFSGYNVLHGLAGPNINSYIKWAIAHKFKEINIYEKDRNIMIKQLGEIRGKVPISLKLGDINNVTPEEGVFYDLDYCCTVNAVEEAVRKFDKNNFIMTFSRRLVGNKTIDRFFEIRNEIVKVKKELLFPIEHTRYATNRGGYIYAPYFDTSAMCCIAKIN